MAMFDSAEDRERRENLKRLEDKRVAFAQQLAQQGFVPERMLFAQNMNGGFTALGRFNGKFWLVISPSFGTDEDFVLESYDELNYRIEQIHVKSEGMGGIFGFGKKAEDGAEFWIRRHDGSEALMSFVCGRGGWLDCPPKKNPLLKTQRRRGNANLVWDLKPLDRTDVGRAADIAAEFFSSK